MNAVDFHWGLRVSALRLLHHLAIYCAGCKIAAKTRVIGVMYPPYPTFYHFTPGSNIESIQKNGLVPKDGMVWLTDWTDPRWQTRCGFAGTVCFRVDPERLLSYGRRVFIMNRSHEFTTDKIPPDCLSLLSEREAAQGAAHNSNSQ